MCARTNRRSLVARTRRVSGWEPDRDRDRRITALWRGGMFFFSREGGAVCSREYGYSFVNEVLRSCDKPQTDLEGKIVFRRDESRNVSTFFILILDYLLLCVRVLRFTFDVAPTRYVFVTFRFRAKLRLWSFFYFCRHFFSSKKCRDLCTNDPSYI